MSRGTASSAMKAAGRRVCTLHCCAGDPPQWSRRVPPQTWRSTYLRAPFSEALRNSRFVRDRRPSADRPDASRRRDNIEPGRTASPFGVHPTSCLSRRALGSVSNDFHSIAWGASVASDQNYGAKRFLLLRMQEQVRPVLSPRACQAPLRISLPAIVRKSFANVFRRKQERQA